MQQHLLDSENDTRISQSETASQENNNGFPSSAPRLPGTKWGPDAVMEQEQDPVGPSQGRPLPHVLSSNPSLKYLDNSI